MASIDKVEVTGTCDSGCGKPATRWFGDTSVATCGSSECVKVQDDRYEQHCKECDEQNANDDNYYWNS